MMKGLVASRRVLDRGACGASVVVWNLFGTTKGHDTALSARRRHRVVELPNSRLGETNWELPCPL